MRVNKVYFQEVLAGLERMRVAGLVARTCVTSPPYYGLRDYGIPGQIGLESTPDEYIAKMVQVFDAVWPVLADDGTLWINIGDTYAANRSYQVPSSKGGKKHSESQAAGGAGSRVPPGMKPKDLIGIPWTLALELRSRGWFLRNAVVWDSPNAMPERVTDRLVASYEFVFLFSKQRKYYFDYEAIQEESDGKMRRKRDVWRVNSAAYKGAHGAVFPPKLIEPCILAGTEPGDLVLDPFMGSGTTAGVALHLRRNFIGFELNCAYAQLIAQRIASLSEGY